jgi:hypothetical protein
MEVGALEIDNSLSFRIFDECIVDVPFAGNCPVEDGCAAGDLPDIKIYVPSEMLQRLPDSVSGDATTDGIDLRREPVDLLASTGICAAGSPHVIAASAGGGPELRDGLSARVTQALVEQLAGQELFDVTDPLIACALDFL